MKIPDHDVMDSLLVRKGTDDQYHLIGHFSNRWRDWDFHADPEHGGEIVSSDAHKEYEKWLDKNRQHAPQLWTWHTFGTARKSRAEWWSFSDNFFWMSWPLTDKEYEAITEWAGEEDLGMSFGFYALKHDRTDGVIDRYRAFEASILPREHAANKWTGISLRSGGGLTEEMGMISEKKKAALVRVHGEQLANELIALDAQMAELLDGAGVDSKEESEEAQDDAATEVAEEVLEQPGDVADATEKLAAAPAGDIVLPALEEKVVAALQRLEATLAGDIKTLAERLAALEAQAAERDAIAEAEAKAMAMPPSVLAAYVPVSILDSGERGKNAVVDGRSQLAKSQPAAPRQVSGYIGALLG
jgi:hypothetical protein